MCASSGLWVGVYHSHGFPEFTNSKFDWNFEIGVIGYHYGFVIIILSSI